MYYSVYCFIVKRRKIMKHDYSENKLREICASSYTYRECLVKIGAAASGGNYSVLKNKIQRYGIDISHFTLQGWNKGKKMGPKRSIEEYLSNRKPIQSWKLKKRLLNDKYFDHKCYMCNKETWMNQPIPIELHHIDGDNLNNNLSNLTILCPNCHALTDNYRGKNK